MASNRVIVWVFLVCLATAVPVWAAPSLLAHGNEDRLWLANGVTDSSLSYSGPLTRLHTRKINESWGATLTIEGNVKALANQGNDLIVLFNDGGWRRFWSNNGAATSAIGLPLPVPGRIVDLASDSQTLWGIVTSDAAHPATTQALPSTSTHAASRPSTRATKSSGLRLFSLEFSQWTWRDRGATPAEFTLAADRPLSLAVINHRPVLATMTDGKTIRVIEYMPETAPSTASTQSTQPTTVATTQGVGWVDLPPVIPNIHPDQFKLLGDPNRPGSILLWVADTTSAGDIYEYKNNRWSAAIPLQLDTKPTGAKAIALAGGRLRLFYQRGTPAELYVRQFELTGRPAGTETPLQSGVDQFGQIEFYLEALLMGVLVIALIGTFYRRRQSPKPLPADQLPLAPLGARFGAGLIDAIPILAAMAVAAWRLDGQSSFNAINLDPEFRWILLGGLFIYLFYTTVAEVLTSRTIGKMIFGLRVVAVEGKPADWSALLMRNILRVVDIWLAWIPLILVFYTPLRQRIGDVAAATVVVTNTPIQVKDDSDTAAENDGKQQVSRKQDQQTK